MSRSAFELDGKPALREAAPLGLQHVLAMFVGNITPIIIVASVLGLSVEEKTFLIQCAMFASGVVTLIQAYPIGPIGSKLPIVQGTSFGFLPTAISIGKVHGISGIFGAALVGGLVECVLGFFLKPLRKLFPPVVTGTVLLSIGLSLLPVGVKYFAGGVKAPDFGSAENLILGTIVLVTILVLKQYTKGFLSVSSILIGITVGFIAAYFMGKLDFTNFNNAGYFSFPTPLKFGISFHMDAIIAMSLMYIVTTVETVGDISGVTMGGANREATDKELSGGVLADGFGSMFAALFNCLPNTSFSQNVGIVALTKVMSRYVVGVGAIILIISGLVPKFGAIFAMIPNSVLGGAMVIVFAMIAVSGMTLITKEPMCGKNSIIVAVALGVGFGLGSVPEALKIFPQGVKMIFGGSGIVVAGMIALVLNLILPEDKKA
jgi:NCS2 family nucleobase:cation symporter-2